MHMPPKIRYYRQDQPTPAVYGSVLLAERPEKTLALGFDVSDDEIRRCHSLH